MRQIQVLRLVWLTATLAVGCGKDHSSAAQSNSADAADTSAACTSVGACGGDLTGNWKMKSFCFDKPSLSSDVMQFCPSATAAISNSTVSGSISYKADKTFTQDAMVTATATLTLPGSCVKLVGSNCTQIEASANSDPASTDVLTCTSLPDGGCQCSSEVQDSSMASGTYSIDKSTVTQIGSDGSTDTEDFCVKGKSLYMMPPMMTMSMGAMGDTTVTGSLVLEKQ